MSLFKTVARPVRSISEQAENAYQNRLEREPKETGEKQLKVIKGFNVDIPVDDIPEKRKIKKETLDEKQRRVVSAYYGAEPEEPATEPEKEEVPAPEEESHDIDGALKAAREEAAAQKEQIKGRNRKVYRAH